MNSRRLLVAVWAGLAALTGLAGTGAASSGGMLSPSVCISPAVFLVVALTPAETIVAQLAERAGLEDPDGS